MNYPQLIDKLLIIILLDCRGHIFFINRFETAVRNTPMWLVLCIYYAVIKWWDNNNNNNNNNFI